MSAVDTHRVRLARPDEHDTVGLVTFRGFGHGLPGARQPTPERRALLLDAAARAADGDLLVAVDAADHPVGTATLLPPGASLTRQARGREAEIRLLAVVPEARRTGIARALMTAAIDRAWTWDVDAVVLDTGPQNTASQALYQQLGFVRQPARETQPASSGGMLAVFRLER
ncbi:GNAT family N-acetyltransferase [Curtobacterium pusillum]|uniref:GNAT family N-acetyltransferase n=1 Tax=Curtobacterium pusillum TaxID=69373 RepID=UPI0038185AF1